MNRLPFGIGDFLIELKEAQTTVKGDSPGHPFRGNQYDEGGGGGLSIDKSTVQRHLNSGSFLSNKFDKKGVGALYDAQKSGENYQINKIGETAYGAQLEIEVSGKKYPLTKSQVRHSDIEGYFGKQPKIEHGSPTGAGRTVEHSDISKVRPQHAAGTGETVQLQDRSVWEHVGTSGYQADNRTNINGWKKIK